MLKARGEINGRDTVLIGLSYGNLKKFKDEPLDTYIHIPKGTMNIPFDILIFSGETEDDLANFLMSKAPSNDAS